MNILSIEASGNTASTAIVNESGVVAEFTLNHKKNHSITLMPLISSMLDLVNQNLQDMDYIAVSTGPGSFTGLRIGAACAKALSHGANKEIIPVPTLDSLAYNVFMENTIIAPIMDARRGEVYASAYTWRKGKLIQLLPSSAESFQSFLEEITELGSSAIFLGDACPLYSEIIERAGFATASHNNMLQRASSVGMLALKLAEDKKAVKYNELTLSYLRKPQAEREYDERTITND